MNQTLNPWPKNISDTGKFLFVQSINMPRGKVDTRGARPAKSTGICEKYFLPQELIVLPERDNSVY